MKYNITTFKRAATVSAILIGTSVGANAAMILVNFGGETVTSDWNTYNDTSNNQGTTVALDDTTDTSSGISLTVTSPSDGKSQIRATNSTLVGVAPFTSFSHLSGLDSQVGTNNGNGQFVLTFTGLDDSKAYTFETQHHIDGTAQKSLINIITGTGTDPVNADKDTIATFDYTPVGGTIAFKFRRSGGTGSPGSKNNSLNALSITYADPIPEPSTGLLLGFAGLGLAIRRKR